MGVEMVVMEDKNPLPLGRGQGEGATPSPTLPLKGEGTILVTGASGFIGSHVSRWLEAAGYGVHRVVRVAEQPAARTFAMGDIDGATDWRAALAGVQAVVHTAARVHVLYESVADPVKTFRHINVEATLNLARQAHASGARRFIFLSTIGVLGNYSQYPMRESDTPNPSNAYSASKLEAEQQLLQVAHETGLEVVILRPPLVYGPGVKANFHRLMYAIARRKPLPFGLVDNARDFISVSNLCSLIVTCIHHPAAANEVLLAADGQAVSTPALIRKVAGAMGVRTRLVPVPVWILQIGARLLRKERFYHSICSSLRIDTHKAQTLLSWQPPQSLDEGLQQTVAWYVTNAQSSVVSRQS